MSYEPAAHYDRVTAAWTLILGEDLHYGVFAEDDEALATATARLTDEMVRAAMITEGTEVLDVGCGTGAPACHLAATLGARVTGITTSEAGVRAASARAADQPWRELVSFQQRDGMDNGLADESFDRTWVLESSHLMRDRNRLIAECARVLRRGGRLALCDIVLRRTMDLLEVRRLRQRLTLLREVFGDARMEPIAEYDRLLEGNGIEVDRALDLTVATRPTFASWRQNAAQHRTELHELLGADALNRFVESCEVLEGFWDDGTLGYALIAGTKR